MIETIKGVLQDISSTNPNLQSEAAREMIARLITAALKSEISRRWKYTAIFRRGCI